MMMVVEAFNHRPVATWYNPEAKANDIATAKAVTTQDVKYPQWHLVNN